MSQTFRSTDRQIRVFISSTFRDMMRERDLLVKEVFPELRRKCAKRFVTFTEVDLRWGITEEQANEGQVLPLCLAEIERSRPYFIGLLGERYGWIPDTIRPEVIQREPWLREHVQGRTSVTELEILHGVLNNPKMADHAFFYFRDPAYANDPALSPEERRDMAERNIGADVDRYGEAEATRRTEERKAKLAALKQRIRESRLPLAEPYPNPRTLARLVRRQFNRLIDRLYPEDQVPDPLVQERMAHEAHAKNKLFACIDRPAHLAVLNAFAAQAERRGQGLVVTGESGGGKTALLAAWARDWATKHPDPEDFLFQHYFGATPDSASPEGFLRRLLGELKGRFGITDEIPSDPEKLRDALPVWLAQTMRQGRIVLVLDGLNQVQGSDPDRRLRFLPRHFPPHVVAIASALPGPALDALRERGWAEHELPLADEAEVDAMVGEYFRLLGRHVDVEGRPLQTALRRELVAARGAKNPLFLRTVLEELRQFGSFERLPDRVRYYLEADNPKDLFLRVLARWQEDFDGKHADQQPLKRDLVRRAMTYLWAARQGLSEPEWLDLLGTAGEPLPRALWTPLCLALEPHLSQRAGLSAFGHDFLRQAVEAAFVPSAELQRAAHLAVADYFERHPHQQEMTPRKAAEWPFQLHAAEAWDCLESCLTDIPLFLSLYNEKTKWELTGYWHSLRRLDRDMGACYFGVYTRWIAIPTNARDHYLAAQLGRFLLDNGLYLAAEPLLERALAARERVLGPEHADTLTSVDSLAQLLESKGDYGGAEPLFRRALVASDLVLGPRHPSTLVSVNNLAELLHRKGDYAGAEPLYRRALEVSERVLGPEHANTLSVVNNLASLLENKGDYAGAEPLHRRATEARERVLGKQHPDTLASVSNLAGLLVSKGDYAGAEPLYRCAMDGFDRVLGPEHPNTLLVVNNLAHLLEEKGDYAGAEPLFRRALDAHERVLGPGHPNTLLVVNNLAHLLEEKGDYAGAESLFRRALDASERVLGPEHPSTLVYVNNVASLLSRKGDHAGAEPLYRRALSARERVLGPEHPDTLMSVNNLAALLQSKGDHAGAEPLYRRALSARERVLGPEHPDTLTSVSDLAFLLYRKGDYAGAEPLFRRALETQDRVLGPEHPDTLVSVNSLALLLYRKGDYAGAEPLFRRALETQERLLGPEHPDTLVSAKALAVSLESKGDHAGAEPLYRRALEGLVKISAAMQRADPNLQAFVDNYARCLEKLGQTPEEVRRALDAMIRPFAISLAGAGAGAPAGMSPRLRAVIVQGMRDPSKVLEIAEQLQREDPELFQELVQWVESPQEAGAPPTPEEHLEALRREVAEKEQALGRDHAETIAALNALGRHLQSMGAFDEADVEYRKALQRAPGDTVLLGNYAHFVQNVRHDFPGARDLYLRALQAEPSDAINRANYAGLCLVMGAIGEAEGHLTEAWRLAAGEADGYTTRTLFLRAALAAARGEDPALYLGQLKTLFDQGIQPAFSTNITVREHLQRTLPAEQFALLAAVYAAVYEPDGLARLSALPAWQAIQSRPLDEPWP